MASVRRARALGGTVELVPLKQAQRRLRGWAEKYLKLLPSLDKLLASA